jgi:hypothetical protein
LRDDGVAEASKAVHPRGNPMSHSTHVGFRLPPATAFSGKLFRWCWLGPPLLLASCTVGVGHIATIVARLKPAPGLLLSRPVIFAKSGPPADAFGVGHILTHRSRETLLFVSKFSVSDDVDSLSM